MDTTTQLVMVNVIVKKDMDWAISSQASWEQDEGSTTRVWSPDRIVKPQECGSFDFLLFRLNNHMYHYTEKHMIKKYYYVYKITNVSNNKIYIGCHETDNLDDGYMGSGKYIIRAYEKYGKENFIKEILEFYTSRQEMFLAESQIVTREFIEDNSTYNLAEGGHGGYKGKDCYTSIQRSSKISESMKNKVMAKNKNGDILKVDKDDHRFCTQELVGITKGKTTVKDINGNVLTVDRDDPRIKSGELVGVTKGLAMMKDSFGNILQVRTDDPRIKSGELVGVTKGHIQTSESNEKRSKKLKGRKVNHTYASCVVCKKSTTITNIIRWHYTGCNQNKI